MWLFGQVSLFINIAIIFTPVHGSQKKGVAAWAGLFLCDDFKVLNNMSWWYDWKMDLRTYHLHVTNKCPVNHRMPEFVPMVYDYDNNTRVNISIGVRYVLGFNEPDQKVQADLTPQEAADAWPDIEKHSYGKPLVSPSMAHHNFVWYDEFFRLCNGCRIDYLSAHAYGCNANHVMSYLEKLYQRYGKKIWLTEFACPKSSDEHQQLHLMQTLLPRLEAAEYIFRYSWFQARINRVMDGGFITPAASLLHQNSSTLTRIGHFYNNFRGTGHSPQVVG